jgi:hypothetical protein
MATELIVALALFAMLLLFLVWEGAALWHAAATQHGILPLQRVLARSGVPSPGSQDLAELVKLANAARRCVACSSDAQCQSWLAGEGKDRLDAFCPNASFVTTLSRRAVRAIDR